MDGNLAKMTIMGFIGDDVLPTGIPFSTYIAMFNPESFTVNNQIQYDNSQPPGSTGSDLRFIGVAPRTFQFEFLVDGTGAIGEKREVFADIQLFKYTTGFVGEIHRTSYVTIAWGTFVATCVLTRMDVQYTLFRPDGTPLRAAISASFQEHTANELQQLISNFTSPDLTHRRLVKSGDKLPLMCYNIYKDPKHYLEVAKANELDTIMNIEEGTSIAFPPFDKTDNNT